MERVRLNILAAFLIAPLVVCIPEIAPGAEVLVGAVTATSNVPGLAPTSEATADADETAAAQLGGAATGELAGNGFTYRHDWGARNGQWKLNLNWSAIQRASKVFAAIGECAGGGGKFIGAARYTLHNIAPTDGTVSIWVNIEWGQPIPLCVDYLVVNPTTASSTGMNKSKASSLTSSPAAIVTEPAATGVMAAEGMVSALQGRGITYRHDWGARNGQWIMNLSWAEVRRDSRVFAAIGECASGGGKFIGAARYTLYNVAPSDGMVSIWVNIEWGQPIPVCVDYLVVTPGAAPPTPFVSLVNIIPRTLSGETWQDSEPFLGIDLADARNMVGSAFTRNPNTTEVGRAPIYISEDAGQTRRLNAIIPSDGMTGDITVAGSLRLKRLHSGILRRPGGLLLNILRTDDYGAAPLMDVRVPRTDVDQPFVQARRIDDQDRVYVGSNDFSLGSQSAAVDVSTDDGQTFRRIGIEMRTTLGQNGPSVRPAVSMHDNTVYVAYFGWRSAAGTLITSDIVVARDDNGGTSATPFRDLTDPSDGTPGRLVATGVTIPWSNAPTLGFERIGSTLSIATDPTNSNVVYVAWADRVGDGDIYSIHVRRSTDRGQNWSGDILRIRDATPFALAIAGNGTVGLLYQQYTTADGSHRWVTHLQQTRDGFATSTDTILADVPGDAPTSQFLPYIGDYNFMVGVGNEFRGIFSTSNEPNQANFPNGVRFQRNVDFDQHRLLDGNGNPVAVSIDPFYFAVSAIQ